MQNKSSHRTFLGLTGWSIANKMNEVPLKSMCPNPSHYLSNGEKIGKLLFQKPGKEALKTESVARVQSVR